MCACLSLAFHGLCEVTDVCMPASGFPWSLGVADVLVVLATAFTLFGSDQPGLYVKKSRKKSKYLGKRKEKKRKCF